MNVPDSLDTHIPEKPTISGNVYMLLSIYISNQISHELNSESARIFKQAVNYMKNNISTSLTITDVAEHCCISATGLKTLFASYAGLGVHKYFLKLKINLATKLLEQGTSVNVVADRLGFSGQAYFSAAYKRETGRSPSDVSKYSKIQ